MGEKVRRVVVAEGAGGACVACLYCKKKKEDTAGTHITTVGVITPPR